MAGHPQAVYQYNVFFGQIYRVSVQKSGQLPEYSLAGPEYREGEPGCAGGDSAGATIGL